MPRHSRALQAGRADTAFLDTLFEHATAAHAFYDADLRFVRVNDAFARLTGLPAEEHPGRTLAEVVPLIPPGLVQAYRRTLQTGVPLRGYEYVVPGHEPDGDIHRRADASVVRGAAGAVLGLVVTVEDVTEQVRALRARRRSEARTARLQVLTGALGGAVTPEQVREIVLREGSRAAGAYGAAIVTPEGEEDLLVMGASGYDGDTLERWRRLPAGGRLPVVQAMRTREAVFCTAADVARDFSDLTPHLQPQTLAVAALPLLAGDRLLGALTLSFADARDAAPEQRPFVRAVAEQCAQALDRARLFDEQRQAGERAALLARVGETLSESLDVRETLDRVASLAVRFVADWCAVYVPNEDFDRLPPQAQRLLPVAVAHDDPTRVEVLRALIERYPSDPSSPLSNEAVLRSGLPVLIERIPEDAVEQIPDPERREMVRALGLHSMLSVPLMAHGRRVGVLGMATSRPERTLTRDDLELAEEIARRAALALDNAQLYEVARRTGERYRSLVDATRQTVWTTDARGVLTGEQPGWSALTGQTRFDEGGEGWAQHVHPDDRERALQAWRRSVRERDVYEVELRMRVRGGDERHFHVRAVPITAPDGEIVEWVGVHTDVTERVEAERALRDLNATLEARVRERTRALEVSERRFRGIFDSQFQFIGLMRPDGVILEANRTALDFGGVTSEDVIGKFLWDSPWWATTEEARHDLRKAVARAALGETVRYDVDVRGAGGVTALIDFSLKPVTDERGDVVMIIPEGRVIDEERRTAALLAAVVSGAPLILYAVDADGTFLLHEGAALASVGLKPGAFVGRNMRELFRDQPDVARPLERALRGETFKSRGAYEGRTFESWYTPMLDARGGVSGMIGVTVDVSEREEAERRREEALERAEVLAALGDALQVASTPEEAASAALERLGPALGASAMLVVPLDGRAVRTPTIWGEPPGAILDVMTRPDLTLDHTPLLARVFDGGAPLYVDDYGREPDVVRGAEGQACAVEPITGRGKNVEGFLVVWRPSREGGWTSGEHDLVRRAAATVGTALERSEAAAEVGRHRDALQELNANLRRSNAELERFAFVASHDLQEPLRTIASFSEVLNRRYGDVLDEPGRKYLSLVTRGAERLKLLIDDLLVFSRLNARREPPRPLAADVPLAEALRRLDALVTTADATVRSAPLPLVLGDESELTQLFQNVVGNAVKFRREGVAPVVEIAATREDGMWHFTVRDNGIGIEPTYVERVFGLFERLHVRDRYEGTGLGLAIVRKIVERHGGRAWIESVPGEGTAVHFTLPAVDGEEGSGGST